MDQPVDRPSIISVRFSVIAVRRPAVPAVRRPALARRPRPELAPVPRPSATTARRLAIAFVLAAAIVLFATVPARVARLVMDSGVWDLTRHLTAAVSRLDPPVDVLPLLLGSIVVLAVVSSSSGHHRCDRW
jgi:hypothetical protein